MSISDARQELREMSAEVDLDILEEFGEQVTYETKDGTQYTVYCLPTSGGNAVMRQTIGTRSQEAKRTFSIPYIQPDEPNWPPAFMCDETITDEFGDVYVVRQWTNNDLVSVHKFIDCVNTKTSQVGATGQ
jgi:hypothetical protein